MSDFESTAGIDEIIEGNPGIDRDQFSDAKKALDALRRSGVRGPSYEIDSPYERRPAGGSGSAAEVGEDDAPQPRQAVDRSGMTTDRNP